MKVTEHNHAPYRAQVGVSKVRAKLRAAATGQMSSQENIARTVRRLRNKAKNAPRNLAAFDELVCGKYKKTRKDPDSLMCDPRDLPSVKINTYYIHSTPKNLKILSRCRTWFVEGIFRDVPSSFYELYTFHGLVNTEIVPLVYVLMAGKSFANYRNVLLELCVSEPRLSPNVIMADFEAAFIRSVYRVFPDASVKGCMYHFSQSIWQHIETSGLQQQYNSIPDYSLNLKMLCALAFVPEDRIVQSYEELINSPFFVSHKDELQPLLNYFEETWIGKKGRTRGRRDPLFSISIWSHYDTVINGEHRTNRAVEEWHNSFNNRTQVAQSLFWCLVDLFCDEQAPTEMRLEQKYRGNGPLKNRRKWNNSQKRLSNAVSNYDMNQTLDYLRGVAKNLAF